MSTYPELTSIKTNDYELKNIKEKMNEIERQKKLIINTINLLSS